MIPERVAAGINDQINKELYSSYLYLAMSAYASDQGLDGMAHWLYVQSLEELTHTQKLFDYMRRQGARVILEAIEKPPAAFGTPRELVEAVLEHEQKVTASIHALVQTAVEEKDFATQNFLQWFVDEQVEEEENVGAILAKFKLAGEHPGGLFMIDRELGARVFTPPSSDA